MIRRVLAVAAVVALSGSGLFLLAEPAGAQACDVTGNPGLLPIVLIHGFNTKPETIARDWKQASNAITKAGGNPVLFDYASKSLEWVTRSGVAERLKATVECLAKASIDAGGSGKVGIVAHSMGGLAVRAALKAGLDPHLLAGLITISTPHLGSAFDSALVRQVPHAIDLLHANSDAGRGMAPGSPDMAGLPVLPADVPAELIGGDVRVCTTVFGWAGPGACVATPDPLVPIQSSLASGWPASPNRTTTTITCNTTLAFFAIDLITFKGEHVPCSHGPIRHHPKTLEIIDRFVRTAVSKFVTPTLGQPWGPYQDGFGQVAPTQFIAGTVSSSSVDSITWEHWGETEATGHGTGYYVAPFAIQADTQQLPAVLVTFDLGLCGGKRMYRKLTWYFPDRGEHLDRSSAFDICTGEPPSGEVSIPKLVALDDPKVMARLEGLHLFDEGEGCPAVLKIVNSPDFSDWFKGQIPSGFSEFASSSGAVEITADPDGLSGPTTHFILLSPTEVAEIDDVRWAQLSGPATAGATGAWTADISRDDYGVYTCDAIYDSGD